MRLDVFLVKSGLIKTRERADFLKYLIICVYSKTKRQKVYRIDVEK